jgi:hypothetical protein
MKLRYFVELKIGKAAEAPGLSEARASCGGSTRGRDYPRRCGRTAWRRETQVVSEPGFVVVIVA